MAQLPLRSGRLGAGSGGIGAPCRVSLLLRVQNSNRSGSRSNGLNKKSDASALGTRCGQLLCFHFRGYRRGGGIKLKSLPMERRGDSRRPAVVRVVRRPMRCLESGDEGRVVQCRKAGAMPDEVDLFSHVFIYASRHNR